MLRVSFVFWFALAGTASAEAPQVVGFDAAVRQALERNPNAQIAAQEIARARAVLEQVRSASLPTLTANTAYTRLDSDRLLNGNVIAPADQLSANLTVAVPLVAPRSWVQWRHARENVDVSRLSAAEVKRELASTVARTYLSVLAQRRVVEVSERARTTAEAHFKFAHQRFAGGYGNRVDEVRAAEEVATDESQLDSALAQLTRLRESLGVLVGADRAIDVTEDVTLPQPPPAGDAQTDAQTARADVQLFRGRLELATRVRRDGWTDYLPSVNGLFQPFYQNPPLLTVPQAGWQAQLALTWPLYDGGLRYGLQKERRALEAEARLGLENTLRQADAEVRAADDEVRRSSAALAAARQAAELAAQALQLTNLGYQAGASTNIEVIDAERRARDADTAVASAEDAWRQGLLDLLIATGRFPR